MEGWKCPGCGKCFAPSVIDCTTCGKPVIGTVRDYPADPPRYCQRCGSRLYTGGLHFCGPPLDWSGNTWTAPPDTTTRIYKSDNEMAGNISKLGSVHTSGSL